MRALFVSDCHLSAHHPETLESFKGFLRNFARDADALYILGDLFDYWVGDDDDTPEYEAVCAELKALAAHTPVYCMRGNRDFALAGAFERRTACRLLPDEYKLTLNGTDTLLMHGDLLCTDDKNYLRYRRVIQHPATVRALLLLPLSRRRRMAEYLRRKSRDSVRHKTPSLMDVNVQAVVRVMRKHKVQLLIHGHTHRPGEHEVRLGDGQVGRRIVLDAWHPYGHGETLAADENGIEHIQRINLTR